MRGSGRKWDRSSDGLPVGSNIKDVMLPLIRYRHRPVQILEQHPGAGSSLGEGAIATDTGVQNVLQCATRHYRHRVGAEDSQTPVRNSDPMAVESRGDLASRHGSIGRIAVAHSWSFRSDNPICNTTPPQETLEIRPQSGPADNSRPFTWRQPKRATNSLDWESQDTGCYTGRTWQQSNSS